MNKARSIEHDEDASATQGALGGDSRHARIVSELQAAHDVGMVVRARILEHCVHAVTPMLHALPPGIPTPWLENRILHHIARCIFVQTQMLGLGSFDPTQVPEVESTLAFLRSLLPPPPADDDIDRAIDRAIEDSGVTHRGMVEDVMEQLWFTTAGYADHDEISQRVWRKLPRTNRAREAREEARLNRIVQTVRTSLHEDVARVAGAAAWSNHYGSIGSAPGYLFIWYVLPLQAQVDALKAGSHWHELVATLRERLAQAGYPVNAFRHQWVDIYSQEDCDFQTGGDWYRYLK